MTTFTKRPNSMHLFLGAVICIFAIALLISNTSYAETEHAPTSKESFLKAWKAHQKNLPTTVTFEKTDEPDTYIYETTLFPYKGKMKIANVVVDKNISYYYDYDFVSDGILKGVVEVTFPDMPEKFFKTHHQSADIWQRQHYLFFVNNRWMSPDQWREFEAAQEIKTPRAPRATGSETWGYLLNYVPMTILLLLYFSCISIGSKKTLKEMGESIELQKQAFKLAEESLALQKEQTDYLRQLLKDKK